MAKKKSNILGGFEELTSEMLPEEILIDDFTYDAVLENESYIEAHHKFSKFKNKGELNKWEQTE